MGDYGPVSAAITLAIGAVLCATGLAFFLILRRWPLFSVESWRAGIPAIDAKTPETREQSEESIGQPSEALPLRRILLGRSFPLFAVAMGFQSSVVWAMSLALQESIWAIVGANLLASLVGVAGLLAAGALSDRFDRRWAVIAILAIQLAFAALFLTPFVPLKTIAYAVVISFGLGPWGPANLGLQWKYCWPKAIWSAVRHSFLRRCVRQSLFGARECLAL